MARTCYYRIYRPTAGQIIMHQVHLSVSGKIDQYRYVRAYLSIPGTLAHRYWCGIGSAVSYNNRAPGRFPRFFWSFSASILTRARPFPQHIYNELDEGRANNNAKGTRGYHEPKRIQVGGEYQCSNLVLPTVLRVHCSHLFRVARLFCVRIFCEIHRRP